MGAAELALQVPAQSRVLIGMCRPVRRPNMRQVGLICTQPSGEITNGAAKQNGGYFASCPGLAATVRNES
jgi:hypothetical protein